VIASDYENLNRQTTVFQVITELSSCCCHCPGMPPGPSGGGGKRGARTTNVREGNDDVRKFLSFYKRRNSVCVELYLPACYQKKPSYDDLAEFVYSVLSVGGTSSPQVH
jgi:hypothetical protein